MEKINIILSAFTIASVLSCKNGVKETKIQSKIVYQSDDLIITQLTNNVYEHTSFFKSQDFGTVPCNGMIVKDNNEVVIYDTPTGDKESEELIRWVKNSMKSQINAVVSTHFHEDCVGGLKEFDKNNIPSFARYKTIDLAKEKNFPVPKNGFLTDTILSVGNKKTEVRFLGEGHTKDNVVGYFSSEKVLFGGCLIKEVNARKGNLEDANVVSWPETVEKVKKIYPEAEIIIPGHGKIGGKQLLDYTINLFKS